VKDMQPNMVFTPVPMRFLDFVWPTVEPLLKPATDISHEKYSVGDIYKGILDGTYVLWVVVDQDDTVLAAVTSRIVQYPGPRKAMILDWVGGSRMSEWMPSSHRVMVEYARENGCTHLEASGRAAWGRYMARYGWKPDHVAYKMELSNGS